MRPLRSLSKRSAVAAAREESGLDGRVSGLRCEVSTGSYPYERKEIEQAKVMFRDGFRLKDVI